MNNSTSSTLRRTPLPREWRPPGSRPRNLTRLVLFLVAAALLGHWQTARPRGRMVVQEGVTALTVPLIAGLSAAADGLHDMAAVLPRAREVRAENRRLRGELADLRRRNATLVENSLEKERLRTLLKLRANLPHDCISAAALGRQLSRWPTAIIIDKGRADGVRPRQPVVAAGGLVGRVCVVSARTAVVVPLTDRNSAAGALIQRSRYAGILEGDGGRCRLNYLPLQADVKPGDVVISSGLGAIFPKGLVIGTVEGVSRNDTAAAKSALVRPSVDFLRVEEVLVIRK
jgi:rod shape-determining protein MreC